MNTKQVIICIAIPVENYKSIQDMKHKLYTEDVLVCRVINPKVLIWNSEIYTWKNLEIW